MEIGDIHFARNDFETASKAYLRVALLYDHPELTPESLFKAGECLEKTGKPDEASKLYEELIKKYPDSGYAAKAKTR
jgi:TolA-binding protein